MKIERQLYILSLLSDSRRGYTLDDITDKLVKLGIIVSRKTIERDIDVLSDVFYIYEEKQNGKLFYFAKELVFKNITLSPSELISIHFIRELLKTYSFLDIGTTAGKIVERIVNNLPDVSKAFMSST